MEVIKNTVNNRSHKISMENRKSIDITGVLKVSSFNAENVILKTIMGELVIKGKELRVNKLNVEDGDIVIEGEIASLVYISKSSEDKESLIKKMFK